MSEVLISSINLSEIFILPQQNCYDLLWPVMNVYVPSQCNDSQIKLFKMYGNIKWGLGIWVYFVRGWILKEKVCYQHHYDTTVSFYPLPFTMASFRMLCFRTTNNIFCTASTTSLSWWYSFLRACAVALSFCEAWLHHKPRSRPHGRGGGRGKLFTLVGTLPAGVGKNLVFFWFSLSISSLKSQQNKKMEDFCYHLLWPILQYLDLFYGTFKNFFLLPTSLYSDISACL